jgi:hypothetical protein
VNAETWDQHWMRIRDDAIAAGHPELYAATLADQETAEQFGQRPAEEQP